MNQSLVSPKKVVPKKKKFWENCWDFQLFFCVQNPLLGQTWLIWSFIKKCWGEVTFFWIWILRFLGISFDFSPSTPKKTQNFFAACGAEGGETPPPHLPPLREAKLLCLATGASGPLRDFSTSTFYLKFQRLKTLELSQERPKHAIGGMV